MRVTEGGRDLVPLYLKTSLSGCEETGIGGSPSGGGGSQVIYQVENVEDDYTDDEAEDGDSASLRKGDAVAPDDLSTIEYEEENVVKEEEDHKKNLYTDKGQETKKRRLLSCFSCILWRKKRRRIVDEETPHESDENKDVEMATVCPLLQFSPDRSYYYQVQYGSILPPQLEMDAGKKTLILDLDETLVHSTFRPMPCTSFVVDVSINGMTHKVYVSKRPGVDEFLKRVGELYEVVVFTASLGIYANPVLDELDKRDIVRARLFREACAPYMGGYVKDISRLGRSVDSSIIIDNSAASYVFHPHNAIPIRSWFDDPNDTELIKLISFLEDLAKKDDIYRPLRLRHEQMVY
eukprot:TRINITY_DN2412_c1_g2_i1.p1 TRINITY_DN2412_c1_g2~~TRINITY_DN2412_c1_g2_i1.p1  ORF type:complete len:350 (-),score=111.77 TRINITY_DN2412_c1_g2_i1:207-1256(-)